MLNTARLSQVLVWDLRTALIVLHGLPGINMARTRKRKAAKSEDIFSPTLPGGRPQQGRRPGRPPIHDEAWTKVTVVLFNRQIVFLDRLAANIRAQSGAAISRAQLLRAFERGREVALRPARRAELWESRLREFWLLDQMRDLGGPAIPDAVRRVGRLRHQLAVDELAQHVGVDRPGGGARLHGLSYNRLIHGLKLAEVDLDRKILADLAVREPETFAAVCDIAREALENAPQPAASSAS